MDTKLAFLHEVLGVEGTRALLKAGEQSQKLENVIVPRTILSWVSAASTMSYEGVLPGVEGFIGFNKSECNGEIKIGQDTYEFENAGVFSVAAAIAVSLGVHEDRLAADLKDKDIVRLGKSIDLLVKSKMAKAEIAKHDFDEVPPEKFESAISRHPNLSSVDANRDYSRKRTYLSSDGMAGYAVTNEGELCHVFSLKPGRGAAAVQHAIAGGATHLNCFDGKLPKYYNQFGFQEEHRERNTDGTGPDVVYMQLPVAQKGEADGPSKGKAAAPGFSQPAQAQAPSRQQGKPPKPSKTMGTPVIPQPAEPDPVRQDNKIANNPSFRVSKSEAKRKCPICMSPQFNDDKLTGCRCLSGLVKSMSIDVILNSEGYILEIPKWNEREEVVTLLEALGKL